MSQEVWLALVRDLLLFIRSHQLERGEVQSSTAALCYLVYAYTMLYAYSAYKSQKHKSKESKQAYD